MNSMTFAPTWELKKSITLLDERPMSWNELYTSKHWSYRAKEARRVHALVRATLDPNDRPFDEPVLIHMTVYFKNRPQDSCNLTAKLYTDGMLAKGDWQDGARSLLWDDDMRYVTHTMLTPLVDKDNPRVVIDIYTEKGND